MRTIPEDPPSQEKTGENYGQRLERTSRAGALEMPSINFI